MRKGIDPVHFVLSLWTNDLRPVCPSVKWWERLPRRTHGWSDMCGVPSVVLTAGRCWTWSGHWWWTMLRFCLWGQDPRLPLIVYFWYLGKFPAQFLLKRKAVLCVCEPVLILTTVSLSLYTFIFLSAFTVPAEGGKLSLECPFKDRDLRLWSLVSPRGDVLSECSLKGPGSPRLPSIVQGAGWTFPFLVLFSISSAVCEADSAWDVGDAR